MSVSTFNFCWTRLKQKHFKVFFSFNLQPSLSTFWTQRQKLQTDTDMHVYYLMCLSWFLCVWILVFLCLCLSLGFTCCVSCCICLLRCVMKVWIIFSCVLDRCVCFRCCPVGFDYLYHGGERKQKSWWWFGPTESGGKIEEASSGIDWRTENWLYIGMVRWAGVVRFKRQWLLGQEQTKNRPKKDRGKNGRRNGGQRRYLSFRTV